MLPSKRKVQRRSMRHRAELGPWAEQLPDTAGSHVGDQIHNRVEAAGANLSVLGDIDEVAARAAPDPKAEEVFAVYALVKGGDRRKLPRLLPRDELLG